MQKAKHSAGDIAKWFIEKNNVPARLYDAEDISPLKLQKLLYYAQGVFMAMTNRKLFDDDIVAWEHGPVVVSVYHDYSQYGRNGIAFTDSMRPKEEYTEEENNILSQVYDYFGQYSAWKLRNMTHEETPWKSTSKNDVIPLDVIMDYFKKNYVED